MESKRVHPSGVRFGFLEGDERDWAIGRSWEEWNQRFAREPFFALRRTLLDSPWGRSCWRIAALFSPEGEPIACMSLYALRLSFDGVSMPVGGIGSFVVLPAWRRQGLGRFLLEQVHATLRAQGTKVAMLYSAIDPEYYARLGYELFPFRYQRIPLPLASTTPHEEGPSLVVRPLEKTDCEGLEALYDPPMARQPLYEERGAMAWDFEWQRFWLRKSLLGDQIGGHYLVATRGEGPIRAYLRLQHQKANELWLLEYGHGEGCEADLKGLFLALPAQLALPADHIKGHFPDHFFQLFPAAQGVSFVPEDSMQLMLCPLDPSVSFSSLKPSDVFIWETNAF